MKAGCRADVGSAPCPIRPRRQGPSLHPSRYARCETRKVRLYAIASYAVAAAAEIGGLLFALLALRENRRIMRRWVEANPNNNADGSYDQIMLLNHVVPALLGASS
jgi:hypothetical protein